MKAFNVLIAFTVAVSIVGCSSSGAKRTREETVIVTAVGAGIIGALSGDMGLTLAFSLISLMAGESIAESQDRHIAEKSALLYKIDDLTKLNNSLTEYQSKLKERIAKLKQEIAIVKLDINDNLRKLENDEHYLMNASSEMNKEIDAARNEIKRLRSSSDRRFIRRDELYLKMNEYHHNLIKTRFAINDCLTQIDRAKHKYASSR